MKPWRYEALEACQHRFMSTGRFAPSPTGDLHVGNLRTALAAWLFARSRGSKFKLRFEDLDQINSSSIHENSQAESLRILSLDWDGSPMRQSERLEIYRDAISDLTNAGLTYRCWCSRREIREATTAPHGHFGTYPGICRDLPAARVAELERSDRPAALRLRCSSEVVTITDRLHGEITAEVDDFVLRRGDGAPAYNLAVVIDDAAQEIDEVVRADDLLDSTPRQVLLQSRLGLPTPSYAHVPLVLSANGDRLAKRHGAVTLAQRMEAGDSPRRVVAVLAASLGLDVPEHEVVPADLLGRFDPSAITLEPWTITDRELSDSW